MATQGYNKNSYNPPQTLARTSHSLSILFNGKRIGMINGWNPSQSKDITPIYELNVETSGLPLENLPGNVRGLTVAINRYDLWVSRFEQVFAPGASPFDMLSNQQAPFSVLEEWTNPDGTKETWEYSGCWLNSVGRGLRSDDNRIVNANAQLTYVFKRRLS